MKPPSPPKAGQTRIYIIFKHVHFPRLSGTDIIPLKSKLFYDEATETINSYYLPYDQWNYRGSDLQYCN